MHVINPFRLFRYLLPTYRYAALGSARITQTLACPFWIMLHPAAAGSWWQTFQQGQFPAYKIMGIASVHEDDWLSDPNSDAGYVFPPFADSLRKIPYHMQNTTMQEMAVPCDV